MENISRAKILFQKYLDRTATEEELQEMFRIFEDRKHFASVYEIFEQEWESQDVTFDVKNLTLEKVRENYKNKQDIRHKESSQRYRRMMIGWTSGIAAGIAVLLLLFFGDLGPAKEVIYQTGYAETREIILDDNSLVKLNANSRLVWNGNWQKTGIRELELQGEAFFEVNRIQEAGEINAKEAEKFLPFRVITPDLTVNVYGTAFNGVERRQNTDVFLESGSVELELNEEMAAKEAFGAPEQMETSITTNTNKIMMEPGDAVSYSVAHHFLEKADNGTTQGNAAWIEGSLSFENERLEEVLLQLEDIYGKTFVVSDTSLLHRKVKLGLPYEDWNTVSGLLTLTLEIAMKEVDGKVILEK